MHKKLGGRTFCTVAKPKFSTNPTVGVNKDPLINVLLYSHFIASVEDVEEEFICMIIIMF